MADHICFIVPPHLLEAMAESDNAEARHLAATTLAHGEKVHKDRHDYFAAKAARGHPGHHAPSVQPPPSIVPNILLEHISKAEDVDDEVKESAARSLALSQQIRDQRSAALAPEAAARGGDAVEHFHRGVYDMETKGSPEPDSTWDLLPGKPVRLEGQPATKDKDVNQAYDSCLKVLQFYKQFFDYDSLDNHNMPIASTVHFAKNFGNAFWLSEKKQMVYGDGDKFIHNFTTCIDVIGHEMTHAVTEFNSALQYVGESGALNEHVSDVFGIMVKQMVENETAEKADWLIGEGCLLPGIKGVALRNMKQPGTAYNDAIFGPDIQPANYKDIPAVTKKYQGVITRDSGGVHIFSGIPNRAFALCAIAFGGYSWEKAGKVWWVTVTTHRIPPTCKFIQFADVTVDVAEELFGDDAAKIVRAAWNEVGVVRKH